MSEVIRPFFQFDAIIIRSCLFLAPLFVCNGTLHKGISAKIHHLTELPMLKIIVALMMHINVSLKLHLRHNRA